MAISQNPHLSSPTQVIRPSAIDLSHKVPKMPLHGQDPFMSMLSFVEPVRPHAGSTKSLQRSKAGQAQCLTDAYA